MNGEKVGALFFLALSIAYGLCAFQIPLIFLAQDETLNARTMPFALSITGALLSLAIIVLPGGGAKRKPTPGEIFKGLDWSLAGLFVVLMFLYGTIMPWIGFVLSSIIFLSLGFYLLGERRIKMILLGSIPLVLGLWLLMGKVLNMYIAPGEIFYILGVLK